MEIHNPMPRFLSSFYERFGLNAYIQGDFSKAEAWFRCLEAVEPRSIRVLRNLGVILLAKGDLAGARTYLAQEEDRYGPSFHRHGGLADLAWAEGKRQEAGRRYTAALAEPEAQVGARHASFRPLLEARLALCADEAIFSRAKEGLSCFHQAEALREAGKFPEAFELFMAAVDRDPSNWLALNNAGSIALNNLARPEEAVDCLARAFALSPSSQIGRNLQIAREGLETARKAKLPGKRKGSGR